MLVLLVMARRMDFNQVAKRVVDIATGQTSKPKAKKKKKIKKGRKSSK